MTRDIRAGAMQYLAAYDKRDIWLARASRTFCLVSAQLPPTIVSRARAPTHVTPACRLLLKIQICHTGGGILVGLHLLLSSGVMINA